MFKTGEVIHLNRPDRPGERVLHSGEIVGVDVNGCTAEFPPPGFTFEAEAETLAYYEIERKFVQQPVRIEEILETEPKFIARLAFLEEPIPAEGREHCRVPTLSESVTAILEAHDECDVQDLSATGFAVLSSEDYHLGIKLEASISYAGDAYSGWVRVMSIQDRGSGNTRYGLRCVSEAASPGGLAQGLQRFSLALQREQLQHQLKND